MKLTVRTRRDLARVFIVINAILLVVLVIAVPGQFILAAGLPLASLLCSLYYLRSTGRSK